MAPEADHSQSNHWLAGIQPPVSPSGPPGRQQAIDINMVFNGKFRQPE
jgi:hypothetical protein